MDIFPKTDIRTARLKEANCLRAIHHIAALVLIKAADQRPLHLAPLLSF